MSEKNAVQIWKSLGAVWLALSILLAITVGSAYIPLGILNGVLNLSIAAIKVGLIAIFFMHLLRSSVLVRLAAAAGIFWVMFLFLLTTADYLTR